MFKTKTVLVIGAGASCELGLPAGDALRTRIADALAFDNIDSDRFAVESLHSAVVDLCREEAGDNWGRSLRRYREAAERLRAGLPYAPSIDTYLHTHRGDPDVVMLGKLGIAYAILSAERESALGDDGNDSVRRGENQEKLAASWYLPFAHMLNSGYSTDTVAKLFENVSFIVFNYDRCLEQFLLGSLIHYFDMEQERAAELLGGAEIVHTYGQVGALPWQSENSTPFGASETPNLRRVAEAIRTVTETVDTGVAARVKGLVQKAETLVFLGFGFLEQNMELLTPVEDSAAKKVFATAALLSDSEVEVIERDLVNVAGKTKNIMELAASLKDMIAHGPSPRIADFSMHIERGFCLDLMRNHRMGLTRQ